MTYAHGRDESPEQRADRNWNELLQELRVTETGVQVLFSLLLTVPFSARFDRATDLPRGVYFAALASAVAVAFGLATLTLWFGPPVAQRLRDR